MTQTETPPTEDIDWAAETAADEAAAQAVAEKLKTLGVTADIIDDVKEALETESKRLIMVPKTAYRVARGIGHQLIITEFVNNQNHIIFQTGRTDLEPATVSAPEEKAPIEETEDENKKAA